MVEPGCEPRSPALKGSSPAIPYLAPQSCPAGSLGVQEAQDTSCKLHFSFSPLHAPLHSPKEKQPSKLQNLLKGAASSCRAKSFQNVLSWTAGGQRTGTTAAPRDAGLPDDWRTRSERCCLSPKNLCKQLSGNCLPTKATRIRKRGQRGAHCSQGDRRSTAKTLRGH